MCQVWKMSVNLGELATNFNMNQVEQIVFQGIHNRRCKRDSIDYVARRIHNHDNATCVAQHKVQYAKLLPHQGYSTVYYAENNSRACKIMLVNVLLTLLCLYLHLWSVESGEIPKMQGTSVALTRVTLKIAAGALWVDTESENSDMTSQVT